MQNSEKKRFMLDTSAIIDDPFNIFNLYENGRNVVLLNNVVYGELNNLKKSKDGEAGFQSREFFRMMMDTKMTILERKDFPDGLKYSQFKVNQDSLVKLTIKHENEVAIAYMIMRKKFKATQEENIGMGNEMNDLYISELAIDYDATLLTTDNALHSYHQIVGGTSEFITNGTYKSANEQNFFYEITVPPHGLEKKEDGTFKANLFELISKKKEHHHFSNFTQFKFIEVGKREENKEVITYPSGRVVFGFKVDNKIEIIDDEAKTEHLISFKNNEQSLYYNILMHPKNKVVTVSGSTGSGKTLLALTAGVELFNEGVISGIVYTRNTVTSNDAQSELGFRKGGEDIKLSYFMEPLYTAINKLIHIIEKREIGVETFEDDRTLVEKFMKEKNIKVVDIAHLRGVTIDDNQMVILDESQNLSSSGLKLIGTRIGEETMFVILGDGGQIDHPFLSKHRNSLVKMLSLATKSNFVAGIKLKKTVRSFTAEWFDKNL